MNTSRICSLALAALAALSCADEPADLAGNEGIETTIALSLTAAPETPGLAGSRALPDPLEVNEGTGPGYVVEDFWLLQFDQDGYRLGAPRYYLMPSMASSTAVAVIIPPVGKIYKCVLIANTHSDAFHATLGSVTTLEGLKTVYKRIWNLEDLYNATDDAPDLLMNGTVNVTSSTTSLTCALYRNVAKLTLTLTNDSGSGVTITSVQLRNVPDRLFYADRLLDGAATPSPSPAQSGLFDLPVDEFELAPDAPVKTLRYYLPRNRQGTTGTSTEAQKNLLAPGRATYIEIMAVTAGAIEDGGGKPLRYRFYPGANMTNDFNIVPNFRYTLPVVFNTAGAVGDSRVENLGQVQLAEANSYILNPLAGAVQTTYGVPVTRVNKFWRSVDGGVPGGVLADNTPWVAEVIWQDGGAGVELIKFCEASGAFTGDTYAGTGDSYFYVSPAGPTARGNVLVGLRKENATDYLWSWHLWITGYNPDIAPSAWQEDVYSYGVPGGGHVHRYSGGTWATAAYADKFIMDRNLGAASANSEDGLANTRGLYYQFGRKDPFPAASVKLYNVSGTAVTAFTASSNDCIGRISGGTLIKTAVQRPYNFYYPASGDWAQNNPYYANLWNNPAWHVSPTGKSLFDPCPPGWKVPEQNTWAVFIVSGKPNAANYPGGYNGDGWEFYMSGSSGETAFYPAGGLRNINGEMSNGRDNGYSRSSAPLNNEFAFYLYFNSENIIPQNANHRSFGLPTRCIQE
jgi:hypothetical protein